MAQKWRFSQASSCITSACCCRTHMVRKSPLLRHFIPKIPSIYQDRLGTNIGKTQNESGVSLGLLAHKPIVRMLPMVAALLPVRTDPAQTLPARRRCRRQQRLNECKGRNRNLDASCSHHAHIMLTSCSHRIHVWFVRNRRRHVVCARLRSGASAGLHSSRCPSSGGCSTSTQERNAQSTSRRRSLSLAALAQPQGGEGAKSTPPRLRPR